MHAADLPALARAVLDGDAVDWDRVEATASPATRPMIRELRQLHQLAVVHRGDGDASASARPIAEGRPASAAAARTQRWGHLDILEPLGSGTFGVVYRAWDAQLDRDVALKLLHASGGDAGPPASVMHEGRLLARVRHPNVVTIHGAATIDGRTGLWMELVRGDTLEQLLAGRKTFDQEEIIAIGRDLSAALAAVHAAGLLHRDVKAQNVVRGADGRYILMDFGAGRERVDVSTEDMTGTPLYLAPEVLRGGRATVQSDLYALGVLLFLLATGVFPIHGDTLDGLRAAHAGHRRVDLRALRTSVPAPLSRAIEDLLDPDPQRRPHSAGEVHAVLEAIQRRATQTWRDTVPMLAATIVLFAFAWWGGTSIRWSAPPGLTLEVLEFDSLGTGEAHAAFARGLSNEIQTRLAGLQGLVLRSYDSGGRPRGQVGRRPPPADFVLSGSILRSGDALRVMPILRRGSAGTVEWTGTFQEAAADSFDVLDKIAKAIATHLQLTLALPRQHRPRPGAQDLFLGARDVQARRDPDSSKRAAALFERAVTLDPDYAAASAGIAVSVANAGRLLGDMTTPDPRIEEAARRARDLNPVLSDTQLAVAIMHSLRREWREAEQAFVRAIELDRSLSVAYTDYVLWLLLPHLRLDDARRQLHLASQRAPRSLDVRRILALVEVEAGNYRKAIEHSQWVLERDPAFPYARIWMGRALALSGRCEQALTIFRGDPHGRAYEGYCLAVMHRRDDAEAIAESFADQPWRQMLIYGGLGDTNRALNALERAADVSPWYTATWMTRGEVHALRAHPRWRQVRARLGLPG